MELQLLETEVRRRDSVVDPTTYDLPVLNFPQEEGETDEAYAERQNTAIADCIDGHLRFKKDGTFRKVVLIPRMLEFIADLFFARVDMAILWKPRGSGGSLAAAVLIFLVNVYHRKSFVNIAGSGEQSLAVYEYIRGFWDYLAEFKRNMILGEPLAMKITLINGVYVKCITGSEKAARGKHPSCLMVDEACQRDERTDLALAAAMQTPMSEPDRMIVLVSTFHHPTGLFQEHWDYADEKGFTKYKWTIFETMAQCHQGMNTATEEDPKALNHCKTSCPLTRKVAVRDKQGVIIDWAFKGCNGVARDTHGFQTYDQVRKAKNMNAGSSTFEIEYEGERPEFGTNIYAPAKIDAAVSRCPVDDAGRSYIEWDYESPKAIGVDWGLQETALVLLSLERGRGYAGVMEYLQLTGKLVPEVARYLDEWHATYSPSGKTIPVFADYSHPYNNIELGQRGFEVVDVPFQRYKDFGIGNLGRYFEYERIRVLPGFAVLVRQLHAYRYGRDGKPVKKDDHGPDALLCAMMAFRFTETFPEDIFTSENVDADAEGELKSEEVMEF